MVSYKITALFFAALATAIPHAHQHLHHHSDQSIKLAPLAGRAVSYDGSCGAWSGMTCPAGTCCGPNNWCGSGDAWCGAGCQAGFGLCGSGGAAAPVAPAAASSSTLLPITLAVATSSSSDAAANKHGQKTRTITTFLTKTLPVPTSAPVVPAPSSSQAAAPPITTSPMPAATTTNPAALPPVSSPASSPPPTSGSGSTYIKTYKGDGSSSAGWPSQSSWLSFENLWTINTPIMLSSCMNAFSVPNNSDQELSDIKAALLSVSASSGVDTAFAFAIMMQESNGCVRAPTTVYSISNPGLFQSHSGAGSCNNVADGGLQNPCPSSEISQMVSDGLTGTSTGDGLQQLLSKVSGKGAQSFYEAARMYNSGSVDSSGDLGRGVATHCYVSDVANRLTGWNQGPTGCDANSVGA